MRGSMKKASNVLFRILRNGAVISEDIPLTSLYHEKDEIGEIGQGNECGLTLDGFSNYEIGDEVQCYLLRKEKKRFHIQASDNISSPDYLEEEIEEEEEDDDDHGDGDGDGKE